MLQAIRDRSQGWFVWTIIIGICLVFALWGVHSYLYSGQTQNVVAKINGEKISQEEINNAINQLRFQQRLQAQEGQPTTALSETMLKRMALQSIVSSTLLSQAAISGGFRVSPEIINSAIANMPAFQVDGQFSASRFQQVLNSLLYSEQEFYGQVGEQILSDQIRAGISQSTFSLPNQIAEAVSLIDQQRKYSYIIIPSTKFLAKVSVSDNEAQDYYHQNIKQFSIPEKVSIEYLSLSSDDLMKNVKSTDAKIQQYYQDNIAKYTSPKEWKISFLLIPENDSSNAKELQKQKELAIAAAKQISAGKTFDAIRSQYLGSESHTLWVSAEELPAALSSTLATMKINSVSDPIQTAQGFEVVKLLAIKPQKVMPYKQIKSKVREAYKQQKALAEFSDQNDQLANITYENPNSLKEAAKALGLPIQTTALFTKNGEKNGLLANPKILTAAFSDSVLSQGNNSDPINISDSQVIVLRIKQHQDASEIPFAKVKSQIVSLLKNQKTAAAAVNLGNKIISEVNGKQSICSVAKKYGLSCVNAGYVKIHNLGKSKQSEVDSIAFQISRPGKGASSVTVGKALTSGGYAVVSLQDIKYGSKSSLSQSQQDSLASSAAMGDGVLQYQLFVKSLQDHAKIIYSKNNQ